MLTTANIADVHAIIDFSRPECGEDLESGQNESVDADRYDKYV